MVKVPGECVLYPCYFNTGLSRAEGRRVRKGLGIKTPVPADIERALKRAGVKFRTEEKHHPAHWVRKEGRIIALWTEGKEGLIKKVAQKLEARK